MGFSVTAAHAIFLVAILAGGSTLGLAVVKNHEAGTEARRVEAAQRDAAVHTTINIYDQTWDGVLGRATYLVDNNGTTTLDVRLLDLVIDGVWRTDLVDAGWTVDGETTNWWSPATTLTLSATGLIAEPSDVVMATEYGTSATFRR